jgi:hypothetical protein
MVVLPEGTGSSGGPPRRGRGGVLFLAAVGVLVGGLIFGSLTTPEPAAIEETSSSTTTAPLEKPVDLENFTIEQIAVGEPLAWSKETAFGGSYLNSVVEHRGWTYLFGSTYSWWEGKGGALDAWRSDDGVTWESLGRVIDEPHQILSVVATERGLMGLEVGQAGQPTRLWLSDDGIGWTSNDLPAVDTDPHVTAWPMAVGATDRLVVVAVSAQYDPSRLFEERLAEQLGSTVDLSDMGVDWDLSSNGVRFTVWGPLGFPLYEATATEIGMSDEEIERIRTGMTPESTVRLLANSDDTGWQVADIDAEWIESITAAPDGALVVLGHGAYGPRTWRSYDGLRWEETGPADGPSQVTPWGDRLIGVADNGRPETMVSVDGETWEGTHLVDHFPLGLGWWPSVLAAGSGGVALTVEAWLESPTIVEPLEPTTVERDGHTFTIDPEKGEIRLDREKDTPLIWRQYSDWLVADLSGPSLTLMDPDTGDALATFGLDELREIEETYWSVGPGTDPHRHVAFAFSPDAERWTIQDITADLGESARISNLEVTEDLVIAVVVTYDGLRGEPGFEIWTAPIP